jgi:putative pyruvate formate lyase activating enzyme
MEYSCAKDYPRFNQESVKEMHRQVGIAKIEGNLMKRGLIIRHLVLPNNIAGTEKIMGFISREISQDTYISLMSQYLPYYKAASFDKLSRRLSIKEYEDAKKIMDAYSLYNGWVQDSYGLERFAGVNIKSVLKKDE